MILDSPWTELAGVSRPDISAWKWVVIVAAMLLLSVPIMVWKERWRVAWRWWKSVLFFVGFLCIAIPVVAGGAGVIIGDTYAKADVDDVVAQVLSVHPYSVARATAIVVGPSENAAGSVLDVPYQGEGIDYWIDFTGVTRLGDVVPCRSTLSVRRDNAPRGKSAPVFARMVGACGRGTPPLTVERT